MIEDLATTTELILNVTEAVLNTTSQSLGKCPRYTGNSQLDHATFKKAPPYRHLTVTGQSIITILYSAGILGSLTALCIIQREKKTKYKNRNHLLMLRCLLGIDLVSAVGMLIQMYIQLYAPYDISDSHTLCVFRVIWRWFGLASGCIALVMAIERYFAITRPFFYQMNITYQFVLRCVIILWVSALALVCMPFIGFGLYYDKETSCCKRHRYATEPDDIAYAYIWFVYGLILCLGITCANLSVTKSLFRSNGMKSGAGRRIRRPLKQQNSCIVKVECINASTPEEVAFAKLMVALSMSFLICWLPQLMTIPMAQLNFGAKLIKFSKVADILMAIHFTLDPYIYVLLRYGLPHLSRFYGILQRHCYCTGSNMTACEDENTQSFIIDSSSQSKKEENF